LDVAYWEALQKELPQTIEIEAMENNAQDDAFVERAVKYLIEKLEA
jgi:hypothetical protein